MTNFPGPKFSVMVAVLSGTALGCAHAQTTSPEKLKLRAGIDTTHDDNFQRAIQSKAAAEQINTQTLDASMGLPFGQQLFELQANLAANRHQTFKQFDFTGQSYNAGWRWSLTPSLVGMVSSKRTETLNSAADSIDPTLRNTNVTRSDSISAAYLLGGPWQLFAEYSKGASVNERALLGTTDSTFRSYSAGVSYVPSAGNSLRYSTRSDAGTSISDYSYRDNYVFFTHALTGNTDVKARAGYMEQRFSISPELNFSGPVGGLEVNWRPSAKTSINANWARNIASFQTQGSTHARTDALSITPRWQVRPTVGLGLSLKRSQRVALGGLNVLAIPLQDEVQESSWDISWQPRKYLSLRGGVSASSRVSNVAGQDYTAQTVKFGAQFTY